MVGDRVLPEALDLLFTDEPYIDFLADVPWRAPDGVLTDLTSAVDAFVADSRSARLTLDQHPMLRTPVPAVVAELCAIVDFLCGAGAVRGGPLRALEYRLTERFLSGPGNAALADRPWFIGAGSWRPPGGVLLTAAGDDPELRESALHLVQDMLRALDGLAPLEERRRALLELYDGALADTELMALTVRPTPHAFGPVELSGLAERWAGRATDEMVAAVPELTGPVGYLSWLVDGWSAVHERLAHGVPGVADGHTALGQLLLAAGITEPPPELAVGVRGDLYPDLYERMSSIGADWHQGRWAQQVRDWLARALVAGDVRPARTWLDLAARLIAAVQGLPGVANGLGRTALPLEQFHHDMRQMFRVRTVRHPLSIAPGFTVPESRRPRTNPNHDHQPVRARVGAGDQPHRENGRPENGRPEDGRHGRNGRDAESAGVPGATGPGAIGNAGNGITALNGVRPGIVHPDHDDAPGEPTGVGQDVSDSNAPAEGNAPVEGPVPPAAVAAANGHAEGYQVAGELPPDQPHPDQPAPDQPAPDEPSPDGPRSDVAHPDEPRSADAHPDDTHPDGERSDETPDAKGEDERTIDPSAVDQASDEQGTAEASGLGLPSAARTSDEQPDTGHSDSDRPAVQDAAVQHAAVQPAVEPPAVQQSAAERDERPDGARSSSEVAEGPSDGAAAASERSTANQPSAPDEPARSAETDEPAEGLRSSDPSQPAEPADAAPVGASPFDPVTEGVDVPGPRSAPTAASSIDPTDVTDPMDDDTDGLALTGAAPAGLAPAGLPPAPTQVEPPVDAGDEVDAGDGEAVDHGDTESEAVTSGSGPRAADVAPEQAPSDHAAPEPTVPGHAATERASVDHGEPDPADAAVPPTRAEAPGAPAAPPPPPTQAPGWSAPSASDVSGRSTPTGRRPQHPGSPFPGAESTGAEPTGAEATDVDRSAGELAPAGPPPAGPPPAPTTAPPVRSEPTAPPSGHPTAHGADAQPTTPRPFVARPAAARSAGIPPSTAQASPQPAPAQQAPERAAPEQATPGHAAPEQATVPQGDPEQSIAEQPTAEQPVVPAAAAPAASESEPPAREQPGQPSSGGFQPVPVSDERSPDALAAAHRVIEAIVGQPALSAALREAADTPEHAIRLLVAGPPGTGRGMTIDALTKILAVRGFTGSPVRLNVEEFDRVRTPEAAVGHLRERLAACQGERLVAIDGLDRLVSNEHNGQALAVELQQLITNLGARLQIVGFAAGDGYRRIVDANAALAAWWRVVRTRDFDADDFMLIFARVVERRGASVTEQAARSAGELLAATPVEGELQNARLATYLADLAISAASRRSGRAARPTVDVPDLPPLRPSTPNRPSGQV